MAQACNVTNYYNATVVANLWFSALTGSTLRTALNAHISGSGVTSIPYTSTSNATTDVCGSIRPLLFCPSPPAFTPPA